MASLFLRRTYVPTQTLFNKLRATPVAPTTLCRRLLTTDGGEDDRRFGAHRFSEDPLPRRQYEHFPSSLSDPVDPRVLKTEDLNALYLQIEMPGLEKDQVKLSVEENTLVIKGVGNKVFNENDEFRRVYSSRIDLTSSMYKLESIKATMKYGVLNVVVPKNDDERDDVIQVNIE